MKNRYPQSVIGISMIDHGITAGLLPLGLTLLVAWMLRKGVNPLLIKGIFVIGILGYLAGFLG